MSSESLVSKELLFLYFAGSATALQKRMIEQWVKENSRNEELFYTYLHEWEMKYPLYQTNTEAAVAEFNKKINDPARFQPQPSRVQEYAWNKKKTIDWQKRLLAASVVLLLLVGAWFYSDVILNKRYSTANREFISFRLEDGSKVVLSENSVLMVPRFGFGEHDRKVHLMGEARFSVVHTPDDQKFLVTTDADFQVEVLGTSFNFSARKGEAKVVLQEGSVKVLYQEPSIEADTSLIISPGDMVFVDKEQGELQLKKVRHPLNYSAWQHGQYVFDQTTLAEIKELLYDNYGLVVTLKGLDESDMTISGSFKAKNANELLLALSETLNINVMRQDNEVILIEGS